jgi:hypothetical protein
MKYIFSLEILADEEQVEKITSILGVNPNYAQVAWGYKLVSESYLNFIDIFINILDNKYDELSKIGIERELISIWMIYEYKEQCNMEFSPTDMRKLSENGIALCISCYEK